MSTGSKVYQGYRALGFVSNHVPLCTRYMQKQNDVQAITCVGKSFHVYNCSKLGIITVGNRQSEDITCIAVNAQFIFVAAGHDIKAYGNKGREEQHWFRGHQATVHILLPFGKHLLSCDKDSNIIIWDVNSEEIYTEFKFEKENFEITAVMHPSTYVNKVLIGSIQGVLQLWNVHTNKRLYSFNGWRSSVTVLEQAPALDVVAIGLANGYIHLHNLKYDETVVSFHQEWGPITAISFRTDGQPVMVTGSPVGHIAMWDLKEKKLKTQIREAHRGSVTGIECLPSEPIMITSSPDNSLHMYIFDMADGGGRLLRQRSGHSAPPTKIRYHDDKGEVIISAGQDSTMRNFSTVHEHLDKSLGRASYHKKLSKKQGLKKDTYMMPAVVDFATELSKESDWDSVVACHHGEKLATTWNVKRSCMGQHKLCHERFEAGIFKNACALCVDISSCGNFAVIGYSSGHIDLYNMQSGLYRGSYGENQAHNGSVRSVCIDGLNQLVISGGSDSCVKFWKFKKKVLVECLALESQVAKMVLHRESGMLAVALDDFTITLFDIENRKVARTFQGHINSITDMAFSSDSRWLVTSSMDSSVRTWDIPTGSLIDCVTMDPAVTSLTFSPTSDFLVTTHVDDVGIYLWSNMTLYKHIPLQPLPFDYVPKVIDLPDTHVIEASDFDTSNNDEIVVEESTDLTFKSPEQISGELITFSLLPTSRWQNLLNLDVIKERNKPKDPPKVPKEAPFFLPTVPGLVPKFVTEEKDGKGSKQSEKKSISSMLPLSEFGKLLTTTADTNDYESTLTFLKSLGPSAIDLEIRSLAPDNGGSLELLKYFLVFLKSALDTNRDYEILQAYLGLFLKLHGEQISQNDELCKALKDVYQSQNTAWIELQHQFQQSLCLVNYLRSAAL